MVKFKIGDLYTPAFNEMELAEIENNLEGISYEWLEKSYTHKLTEQELLDKKNDLANICIDIVKLERQKKELNAEIKAQLEQPLAARSELIETIKHKSEHVTGKVYLVDDQDHNLMYIFDTAGICVDIRDLQHSEKQTKLKQINVK